MSRLRILRGVRHAANLVHLVALGTAAFFEGFVTEMDRITEVLAEEGR